MTKRGAWQRGCAWQRVAYVWERGTWQGARMARVHAWQGACMAGSGCSRGACIAGGMCAGETATEAGGMHPTGMHSC